MEAVRRVLFVECCPPPNDAALSFTTVSEELKDTQRQGLEIRVVAHPSLLDLQRSLQEFKPQLLYCTGGFSPYRDLLNARHAPLSFSETNADGLPCTLTDSSNFIPILQNYRFETVYIDASLTVSQVAELRAIQCCENLIYWPSEGHMCSAVAAQFVHCFFAMQRNLSVSFSEAYALASHSVQLLCDNILKERPQTQLLPSYWSPAEPALPQCSSVPLEIIPDVHFLDDDVPDIEGWENVLLLAPKAEVRLLVCGGPSIIDAARLSLLGESLRALLVTEMRSLTVTSIVQCDRVPSTIAPLNAAVRCHVECASGIEAVVVLGGPLAILQNKLLVQHALRQTLVVDSLCLQFRLPPPTFPATTARSSAAVAGGTPVVDALVVTSVWTVHVLRGLCQDPLNRGLVSLGIAGVGGSALVNFKPSDTLRYNTIVTGLQNQPLSPDGPGKQERYIQPAPVRPKPSVGNYGQNGDMDIDLADSLDNDSDYDVELDPEYDVNSKTGHDPINIQMPNIAAMNYHSTRPPLPRCSEPEFYDDLVTFLEAHRGKAIDRKKFPEPILNGVQLDLFNLYKEVASRGGFRVGNGINWKGQVFPKMRNWTARHKMTGVGNSLKKHYQNYLYEYEMVHSKDLKGDGCWLCGSNDDLGTDWIECEQCERWIHFACDRRPFLGTFKEYATGDGGRPYYCPECADYSNLT